MDGNSLGVLSKRAEKTLLSSLEDWKNHGRWMESTGFHLSYTEVVN